MCIIFCYYWKLSVIVGVVAFVIIAVTSTVIFVCVLLYRVKTQKGICNVLTKENEDNENNSEQYPKVNTEKCSGLSSCTMSKYIMSVAVSL